MHYCVNYSILFLCIVQQTACNPITAPSENISDEGGNSKVIGGENMHLDMRPFLVEANGELGHLVEGDIMLIGRSHSRSKRSGVGPKWPYRRMPFQIRKSDYSMPKGCFKSPCVSGVFEREVILSALRALRKYTCIRLEPKKPRDKYYVVYHKDGKGGCWSILGRTYREYQPQKVSLGRNCLTPGTIQHETMHALGFQHEHTRPDRDDYVTIQWDNIKKGNSDQKVSPRLNFLKFVQTSEMLAKKEYDYASVMHYHGQAFTKNGEPTILALKPKHQNIMGQRKYLSLLDIKLLNLFYHCRDRSPRLPAPIDRVDNPAECNFDKNYCGWIQDHPVRIGHNITADPTLDQYNDQLDWLRVDFIGQKYQGRENATWHKGPKNDISGSGRYLIMDSGWSADKGDLARIRTPMIPTENVTDFCITFWYFMEYFGQLSVYYTTKKHAQDTSLPHHLWTKTINTYKAYQNESNIWTFRTIPLSVLPQSKFQIVFEAKVLGSWGYSDVAIDNFAAVKGTCM